MSQHLRPPITLDTLYPTQDNMLVSLTGKTRRIVKWLITKPIQDIINTHDPWSITLHGKGDSVQAIIEHRNCL